MSVSRRFAALERRLHHLRLHFLPKQISPVARYTPRQYDLARAFVVLAHAEFEAYIEDRSTEIVQRAANHWRTKGRYSHVLRRVCAFRDASHDEPWLPFNKDPRNIDGAFKSYEGLVKKNHGIREINLLKLVFPIGIKYEDIEAALMSDLDIFGSSRGEYAHSSIKTQQPIDVSGHFTRVSSLLQRLRRLDRQFNALR